MNLRAVVPTRVGSGHIYQQPDPGASPPLNALASGPVANASAAPARHPARCRAADVPDVAALGGGPDSAWLHMMMSAWTELGATPNSFEHGTVNGGADTDPLGFPNRFFPVR